MNLTQAIMWIKERLENNRLTLVDIGARGGLNTRWRDFSPVLKAIGFEPDKKECDRINQTASSGNIVPLHCFPHALGEQDGITRKYFICSPLGASSLYEPNLEFISRFPYGQNLQITGTETMTLSKLDTVCLSESLRPDYIKIDTQGSELNILRGGRNILSSVKFLELEVEFNPMYKDQPLFGEVDSFLRSKGFYLLGLRRTLWRRILDPYGIKTATGGQLIHGDAIYYNERLFFSGESATEADALKFLIILSAYEQCDLLTFLLGTPYPSLATISVQERTDLAQGLTQSGMLLSSIFRKIRQGTRHARLRKLVDSLRSASATSWHDSDFF